MISEKDIAFPKLTAAQIATLESRGHRRAVRRGDVLFAEGARGYSFYVVVSGAIEIVESSRGTPHTVVVHHPQHFTGDVDMAGFRYSSHIVHDSSALSLQSPHIVALGSTSRAGFLRWPASCTAEPG